MSGGIETKVSTGEPPSPKKTKVEWLMPKGPLTPEVIAQRTEALNALFNVQERRAWELAKTSIAT
ncbi:MAG: hypothetical protein Q7R31_01010 [Candidatus Levybacteria bacterium]|nr:hypothetical protein [Candidatus Levybacteria bacterium]